MNIDDMKAADENTRLEVLVVAYGKDSMERIATPGHLEVVPGVRYIVSWQPADPTEHQCEFPATLRDRSDVKLLRMTGRGVSRNRNNVLNAATAPLLLCADDDIVYRAEGLRRVIETMNANPAVDIAVFRSITTEPRQLPKRQRQLSYAGVSKSYYPYSYEIALRRESIERVGLRFNELFGINAPVLGAGEEDVFLYEAWTKGLNLTYFPVEILEHRGPTTIYRRRTPDVMMARGAVLHVLHPRTAVFRIFRLAMIQSRFRPREFSRILPQMLKGRVYAIRHVTAAE